MVAKYIWINLIIFVIGYLIGSLNLSIFISKKNGEDIREKGSKNAGTTNALRVYGKKIAICVFLFDALKAYLSIMVVFIVKTTMYKANSNYLYVLPLIIGAGALLGHIFPLYFKFKGGKGVACFIGMLFAFNFSSFLIFLVIYLFVILCFRMSSLGSILSITIISLISFDPTFYNNVLAFMQQNTPYPIHSIIMIFCVCIVILKHIPNFIRIDNHTESKLKFLLDKQESQNQI